MTTRPVPFLRIAAPLLGLLLALVPQPGAAQTAAAAGDPDFGNQTEPSAALKATYLSEACSRGDAAAVKRMVGKGADPNGKAIGGHSLLGASILDGSFEVAAVLIQAKADVNAKDDSGSTPLLLAVGSKHLPTVKLLLKAGADPNVGLVAHTGKLVPFDGQTPLMIAAADSATPDGMVEALLEAKADVNAKDALGRTALMLAVASGSPEVAKTLIKAHAAVNDRLPPPKDVTVLMIATMAGRADIVVLLISAGADVNATANGGTTALQLAEYKHIDAVATILAKAAANQKAAPKAAPEAAPEAAREAVQ